jgi:hypothetical protein
MVPLPRDVLAVLQLEGSTRTNSREQSGKECPKATA